MLIETDPGNFFERLAKFIGFGFYASHLGRLSREGTYMLRYVLRLPFGWTLRLHCILRSDADRHLHDHPFDFTSLLLTGPYTEITRCECTAPDGWSCHRCYGSKRLSQVVPRWSLNRKRAEEFHAVQLEKPVWTLVLAGPKRKEWGFATEIGWCHNEEYSLRWPEHSASTKSREVRA